MATIILCDRCGFKAMTKEGALGEVVVRSRRLPSGRESDGCITYDLCPECFGIVNKAIKESMAVDKKEA